MKRRPRTPAERRSLVRRHRLRHPATSDTRTASEPGWVSATVLFTDTSRMGDPHLHWHVIARFEWDSHFPSPVWAAAQRPSPVAQEDAVRSRLPALEAVLRDRLARC